MDKQPSGNSIKSPDQAPYYVNKSYMQKLGRTAGIAKRANNVRINAHLPSIEDLKKKNADKERELVELQRQLAELSREQESDDLLDQYHATQAQDEWGGQNEQDGQNQDEQEPDNLLDQYHAIKAGQEDDATPLIAINADFTHDKRELAHDYAISELAAENKAAGLIKRIWKGGLFKKYYEVKYEREIMEGKRDVNADGERMSLDQVIQHRSGSAIERFICSVTEEGGDALFHDKGDNGEHRTEANEKVTKLVGQIIEHFAKEWAKNNTDPDSLVSNEDIKRKFNNAIRFKLAQLHDSTNQASQLEIDNYYDTAIEAANRAKLAVNAGEAATHELAINRVMKGFKVYNADVRNNIRTQAHRDAIDNLVNKFESTKFGSLVPPEIIAAAVGATFALTQTGVRAVAGAAGGIGLSSVLSALKEHNRVTNDRIRMMRDAAIGVAPGEKRTKYEAKLWGTNYDIRPATELISQLSQAMGSKNNAIILDAIAAARVRIDYSDEKGVDLISYSSMDKVGDERLQLDLALLRAERSLTTDEARSQLDSIKSAKEQFITGDIEAKDKDFRKLRAFRTLKQAGKTVAIGSTFFLGMQELSAAFDPHKIGLLEKRGLIKTVNEEGASETVLAKLFGGHAQVNVSTPVKIESTDTTKAAAIKESGYQEVQVTSGEPTTTSRIVEVRPANSSQNLRVNTVFADNGTKIADGNELGLYLENGRYVANMSGSSTMGGEVFNLNQLASAGKIKAHLEIGGGTFEIQSTVDSAGHLCWNIDPNGNLTTTAGTTIKAFGDNGEKLFKSFRVVVDNGSDADGVIQAVSLAADAGADTFNGVITEVANLPTETSDILTFINVTASEYPSSA